MESGSYWAPVGGGGGGVINWKQNRQKREHMQYPQDFIELYFHVSLKYKDIKSERRLKRSKRTKGRREEEVNSVVFCQAAGDEMEKAINFRCVPWFYARVALASRRQPYSCHKMHRWDFSFDREVGAP